MVVTVTFREDDAGTTSKLTADLARFDRKPAVGEKLLGAIDPIVWSRRMDNTDIEEMFSALGPVTIKRMFGGKGVYHKGRIVAVEVRDEMLLKADSISGPDFEAAGSRRWAYEGKKGRPVTMPYWSIPEDAFDDPDTMARWVRLAYEAALRASSD